MLTKYYCTKDGQRVKFTRPVNGFYAAMGVNGSIQGQLYLFAMDFGSTCLIPIYDANTGKPAILPHLSGMQYSENLKKWISA